MQLSSANKRHLTIWLSLVALLVLLMVVVGGVTRLTHSGLSMVEWRPLVGTIPPLNEEEWGRVFGKYKQFPEYRLLNEGMTLSEFKLIFFWEYAHRVLGRLIGLVFFLPFVFFWWRGYFDRKRLIQLSIGLLLGASQGLMGWYMVKSGLVDVPYVSHYRLAAHLGLAFLIEAYLFWIVLDVNSSNLKSQARSVFIGAVFLTLLVALQIIYGAFVAGMKAGFGFNTFPLMNGQWIPPEIFQISPLWKNFFENGMTLQFAHRWLGVLVLVAAVLYVSFSWKRVSDSALRKALLFLVGAVTFQVLLGVATLVYVIPISLAVMHQLGALLVMSSLVLVLFLSRRSIS